MTKTKLIKKFENACDCGSKECIIYNEKNYAKIMLSIGNNSGYELFRNTGCGCDDCIYKNSKEDNCYKFCFQHTYEFTQAKLKKISKCKIFLLYEKLRLNYNFIEKEFGDDLLTKKEEMKDDNELIARINCLERMAEEFFKERIKDKAKFTMYESEIIDYKRQIKRLNKQIIKLELKKDKPNETENEDGLDVEIEKIIDNNNDDSDNDETKLDYMLIWSKITNYFIDNSYDGIRHFVYQFDFGEKILLLKKFFKLRILRNKTAHPPTSPITKNEVIDLLKSI